jgi:hypothetical protein
MGSNRYALRRTLVALQQALYNGPIVEAGPRCGVGHLREGVNEK